MIETDRSLIAQAQALSARLASLNELTVAMQASITADIGSMLHTMIQQARWVLDFDHCSVVLHHDGILRHYTLSEDQVFESEPIGSPRQRSAPQRIPLLLGDLPEADGGPIGMRSAVIVPLHTANLLIGALHFYASKRYHYSQDDLRIAQALGLQVAVILQNAQLLQTIKRARDERHTILETIRDGVLVVNLQGRVVLSNQALHQLLNSTTNLVGTRAIALLRRSHAAEMPLIDRQVLRETWHLVRSEGVGGANDTFMGVNRMVTFNDGRIIEWAGVPLIEAGVLCGYVLTLRDVSTKIALERLREDLTQMLVHDLRSPITSILMGVDLLQGQLSNEQIRTVTLEYMRQGANRMLERVNTLLDVNKLEVGRTQLALTVCDVYTLVEGEVNTLVPLAQANEQHILLNLDNHLPLITCDVSLIRRVFQNLLDNALKFSPVRGRITVSVSVDTEHQCMVFSIRDSGPGVPEEFQQHIFEKYGEIHQQGNRRGTGLGLTFCRLAVEAHHGQIGVRNVLEGGSNFWFTLPLIVYA